MRLKNGWWIPGPRQLAIVLFISFGLYATLMVIEPDLPEGTQQVEQRAKDPFKKAKKNSQKAIQWLFGGGLLGAPPKKAPEKPPEQKAPEQKKGETP